MKHGLDGLVMMTMFNTQFELVFLFVGPCLDLLAARYRIGCVWLRRSLHRGSSSYTPFLFYFLFDPVRQVEVEKGGDMVFEKVFQSPLRQHRYLRFGRHVETT